MGAETHLEHEVYYYSTETESVGYWFCMSCGETLEGEFLDKELTELKIDNILHDLDDSGKVEVGSSSQGDYIVARVQSICHEREQYDEETIISLIGDVLAEEDF